MSELKWGDLRPAEFENWPCFSMATPSRYAASTWRMAGNGECTHSPAKAQEHL